MQIEPLAISGAWVITPKQFSDDRGVFLESFRADHLLEATGYAFDVRQTNTSVSSRGTLRGIHFADVPPGQAKYVSAQSGSFLDFVVDIRVGSPTFGQWEQVLIDTVDRRAVLLTPGLGHALFALSDGSTAGYLCSEVYSPGREHGVTPLDPEIGLTLPPGVEPLLSPKDAAAPSLADAVATGLLPTYASCAEFVRGPA